MTRWVLVVTVGGKAEARDVVTAADEPPDVGPVAHDRVALDTIASRVVPFDGPRIKRTLLVRVHDGVPPDVVARFEASLAAMPDHIDAIRSWALSRADPARSTGGWTHVWEQEFADLDGLRRDYMRHPYHWTGVERWFDPEIPGAIVDPRLAHLIRHSDGPVIGLG